MLRFRTGLEIGSPDAQFRLLGMSTLTSQVAPASHGVRLGPAGVSFNPLQPATPHICSLGLSAGIPAAPSLPGSRVGLVRRPLSGRPGRVTSWRWRHRRPARRPALRRLPDAAPGARQPAVWRVAGESAVWRRVVTVGDVWAATRGGTGGKQELGRIDCPRGTLRI